jgi:hypothetical protein
VVGPLVATFGQSLSGNGGGLREYTSFFDFRNGAQGESMFGSVIISFKRDYFGSPACSLPL